MHSIIVAGVLLAGLPVLLHLIMKQEPKRLPFPAFRFLKVKQKTNQRKMRLRHFLLLLLRVVLIALFAATLYQPVVESQSFLKVLGDQPVTAVFVVDTSPSMGYAANDKTRLDEARARALELLDDLPAGSRVAVLDTVDPVGTWEQSVSDARRKLEAFKEPRGGGPPVTAALGAAYRLLQAAEKDADAADPSPKLVAIFSDRTANSWNPERADDLKKARDGVTKPPVSHLYVDVGVDQPADVAIMDVAIRPQVVPQNLPVTVDVTVAATGPDVPEAVVKCRLDGATTPPEKRSVRLPAGTPQPVQFTFRDLKPGLHQLEVTLETPDRLLFNNTRFATFRVGEARKILTIADDPDDAIYWQLAHQTKGEFACDVKKPDDIGDLGPYEAVVLLSVSDPSRGIAGGPSLWARLADYTARGGKVIVIPGGPEQVTPAAYDPANAEPGAVLPGKLGKVVETEKLFAPPADPKAPKPPVHRFQVGVPWAIDDAALRHPFMTPFRDWQLRGNVDFLKKKRLAWKFWEVEAPSTSVVVYYDADEPSDRRPALLEKSIKGGGKVLLLTTRMDTPWEDKPERKWHDYWETSENSWYVVFPNLLVRYLCGSAADANFNYLTGQAVSVPVPKGGGKARKLILEGPGVTGRDGTVDLADKQTEFKLPPTRTLTAGNFVLRTEDKSWREGFSLNAPGDESNLAKVPPEAITDVCGPKSIIPAEKNLKLRDVIEASTDHPIDLTPWLLIGVLLLFTFEGVFANRFYRARPTPG